MGQQRQTHGDGAGSVEEGSACFPPTAIEVPRYERRTTPLAREPIADTMPTVRLTIDGMKCDGCASRVEDNLEDVSGVETAEADHVKGTAELQVTAGKGDADAIRGTVEELGYDVTGLQGT